MATIRPRPVFSDSTLTIVAIESIEIEQHRTIMGNQLFGAARPVAVVICAPDSAYALDMSAKSIDFERLRQEIPGLEAIITSHFSSGAD